MSQSSDNDSYGANVIDPRSEKMLMDKIDAIWMQIFAQRFQIVSRPHTAHTRKHALSPSKQKELDGDVSWHLGYMCILLSIMVANENDMENADKTHFVINMGNGRILGFAGESELKYAEFVSGEEGMSTIARYCGGRDARI